MIADRNSENNKTTGNLLTILNSSRSVQDYLTKVESFMLHTSLGAELKKLMDEKGLKAGEIFDTAGLSRSTGYDILSGKKHPSREKVLALIVVMGLSQEEAQNLLKHSAYPTLYAKDAFDSAILFCLQNHLSLIECNDILDRLGYDVIPN